MKDLIKEMISCFFIIYTGCMLGTWVFCKIYYPNETFGLEYFQWMALFALAGDLPMLVLYSRRELTEKQQLVRMAFHFVLLEVVLMVFAKFLGIYETFTQGLVMALIIMGVYSMVRLIEYVETSRTARKVNARLMEMQDEDKGDVI